MRWLLIMIPVVLTMMSCGEIKAPHVSIEDSDKAIRELKSADQAKITQAIKEFIPNMSLDCGASTAVLMHSSIGKIGKTLLDGLDDESNNTKMYCQFYVSSCQQEVEKISNDADLENKIKEGHKKCAVTAKRLNECAEVFTKLLIRGSSLGCNSSQKEVEAYEKGDPALESEINTSCKKELKDCYKGIFR